MRMCTSWIGKNARLSGKSRRPFTWKSNGHLWTKEGAYGNISHHLKMLWLQQLPNCLMALMAIDQWSWQFAYHWSHSPLLASCTSFGHSAKVLCISLGKTAVSWDWTTWMSDKTFFPLKNVMSRLTKSTFWDFLTWLIEHASRR